MLLIAVVAVGCRREPAAYPMPSAYVSAYVSPSVPGALGSSQLKQCTAEQLDAATELAHMRMVVKTDPVGVMLKLGLSDDDFNATAQRLYAKWRQTHTPPAATVVAPPVVEPTVVGPPPAAPAAANPVTFEDGVPVILVDHWYWCFAAKAGGADFCAATKQLCEQWMASLGTGSGCSFAPQGVCFHTSKESGLCFRTPAECKAMTEVWAANKRADPITIGCTILRRSAVVPTVPTQPTGWWCVTHFQGRLGDCVSVQSECDAYRTKEAVRDGDASACTWQRQAACFEIAYAGVDGRDEMCRPTLAMCADHRDYIIRTPNQGTALTECRLKQ